MKNILIAQLKQLGRGKLKYIVFVLVLAVTMLNVAMFYAERENASFEVSACYFIMGNLFVFYTLIHIFIAISISDICAGDFSDKTFYYEIMSGKTRFSSYFSRAVIAIIFTLIGSLLIITFPVVLCTLLCGWGSWFTVRDIAGVIAISVAPLVRIICTYISLAFIIRNTYAVMALGMGGFMLATMTEMPYFAKAPSEILGVTSISRLCAFDIWQNYTLTSGNVPVVDVTMPADETLSIIIWSAVFSAVLLLVGYSYFKRDDLN